jgi:hypothetical protein
VMIGRSAKFPSLADRIIPEMPKVTCQRGRVKERR